MIRCVWNAPGPEWCVNEADTVLGGHAYCTTHLVERERQRNERFMADMAHWDARLEALNAEAHAQAVEREKRAAARKAELEAAKAPPQIVPGAVTLRSSWMPAKRRRWWWPF